MVWQDRAKLLGGATSQINGGPGQIQWIMPDNNAGNVDMTANLGDNMVLPPYSAVWSVISGWTGLLASRRCGSARPCTQ